MSGSDSNPQDLVKLRFLMSHYRENSVRNKEMGKKWIYLLKFREKHTPQTVCSISEGKCGGWVCLLLYYLWGRTFCKLTIVLFLKMFVPIFVHFSISLFTYLVLINWKELFIVMFTLFCMLPISFPVSSFIFGLCLWCFKCSCGWIHKFSFHGV